MGAGKGRGLRPSAGLESILGAFSLEVECQGNRVASTAAEAIAETTQPIAGVKVSSKAAEKLAWRGAATAGAAGAPCMGPKVRKEKVAVRAAAKNKEDTGTKAAPFSRAATLRRRSSKPTLSGVRGRNK